MLKPEGEGVPQGAGAWGLLGQSALHYSQVPPPWEGAQDLNMGLVQRRLLKAPPPKFFGFD